MSILTLYNSNMVDALNTALATPHLYTTINLNKICLTSDRLTLLIKFIKVSTVLKALHCTSDSSFYDQDLALLADTLKTSTTLEDLVLPDNHITSAGAQKLAELLATNPSIQKLNLWNNNIDLNGAQALAASLEKNTTLKELNIGANPLTDAGIKAILTALQPHTQLTDLLLNTTHMGTTGIIAVEQFLKTNTSLKALNLAANNLQAYDISVLVDALQKNKTLEALVLRGHTLSEHTLCLLGTALATNRTLKTLDLQECHITDQGLANFVHHMNLNGKRPITLYLNGNHKLTIDGGQVLRENPQIEITEHEIQRKLGDLNCLHCLTRIPCAVRFGFVDQPQAPVVNTYAPATATMGKIEGDKDNRPKAD